MVENKLGLTAFLRAYLPTFCWQTTKEIDDFVCEYSLNFCAGSVPVAINKLAQKGIVESRKIKTPVCGQYISCREYRRVA